MSSMSFCARSGALVPRLIGQTSRAQAGKEQPAAPPRRSPPWTAAEVLESIAQPGPDLHAEIVRDLAEIDQLVEEMYSDLKRTAH